MTRHELIGRRWAAQDLAAPGPSPENAVARRGAVQAQDYAMSLLAIALRSGASLAEVEASLDSGKVIRTHVLRPTWHLVAAEDLRWMLALTGPRILAAGRSEQRRRGITAEDFTRSRLVIERELKDGPQTREALSEAFAAAGLSLEDNRTAHYLMEAELISLVCSGPRIAGKASYDLMDRRVPPATAKSPEEAAAELALRYIRGHGPATERDFVWWSGLSLTVARKALESCRPQLVNEGGEIPLWFDPEISPVSPPRRAWLPAFDEYLIAFADRSAAVDPEDALKWVTKNGLFFPVILQEGRVVGIWKRKSGPRSLSVEATWFHEVGEPQDVVDWERRLAAWGPQ